MLGIFVWVDEALCAVYSARMPPHPYRFREEEKGTENFGAHQSYAWQTTSTSQLIPALCVCSLACVVLRARFPFPPVVPLVKLRLLRN